MFGGAVANGVNAALEAAPFKISEPFENQTGMSALPFRAALVSGITLVIILGLLLLFGQYLWNNVLHVLVPGVKEAKSVWQILGISILIMLLSPGTCQCAM
jgi:hypothetical protein|uniref:Uncharacterized protein n=1 Tax=viral metagenome TaxID=1070528 RepID=A0A6C0LQZ3_9ZZZZ